jgi:S1-C subfamily serine protease
MQFAILLLAATAAPAQNGTLSADEQNTIAVFRQASRGVVHITAQITISSPFVKRATETSTGTGFLIDTEGRVLTAFHVIKDKDEITVMVGSKPTVARLIGTAPQLDIALLQVDVAKEELFPLRLGSSQDLEVGQKVMAIGNAVGLHNSLTVGVVSAVKRSLDNTAMELEDAFIQTDAAINPGNSGGPLLNSAGQVVGINDAILTNTQNMGFAIPIDLARRIIPDLIEMGHPYRPMLGFSGSEVTPSLAKLFGLPVEHGFLVEEVLPHSPAQHAGLHAGTRLVMVSEKPYVLGGDIIVGINGESFISPAQLSQILVRSRPGQRLELRVYRQGQTIQVDLPLEKMQMEF